MGLDENFNPGSDEMKHPRGILDYTLSSHPQSDVTWKVTGNLHGENYEDKTRGPLNEGGFYAERQGWHLPGAPVDSFATASPLDGFGAAGVGFYATSFDLDIPSGYDIPLSFVFANGTTNATAISAARRKQVPGNGTADGFDYRAVLYVNGYQFGKYGPPPFPSPSLPHPRYLTKNAVHNIGPQDAFPVPEGILNYRGTNYVALLLWALDAEGAKLDGFDLAAGVPVLSGYGAVVASPQTGWSAREGAY